MFEYDTQIMFDLLIIGKIFLPGKKHAICLNIVENDAGAMVRFQVFENDFNNILNKIENWTNMLTQYRRYKLQWIYYTYKFVLFYKYCHICHTTQFKNCLPMAERTAFNISTTDRLETFGVGDDDVIPSNECMCIYILEKNSRQPLIALNSLT